MEGAPALHGTHARTRTMQTHWQTARPPCLQFHSARINQYIGAAYAQHSTFALHGGCGGGRVVAIAVAGGGKDGLLRAVVDQELVDGGQIGLAAGHHDISVGAVAVEGAGVLHLGLRLGAIALGISAGGNAEVDAADGVNTLGDTLDL